MGVRRHLAVAVLAPVFLLIAGCGGEEPVPRMPESTAGSAPSATLSSPAARESPEEFIRRWREAVDQAQASGDTSAYRDLEQNCKPCSEFADQVDAIYEAGGSIETEGTEVVEIVQSSRKPVSFDVTLRAGTTTIRDKRGAEPRRLSGGTVTLHVFIKRSGRSWNVYHYTVRPS